MAAWMIVSRLPEEGGGPAGAGGWGKGGGSASQKSSFIVMINHYFINTHSHWGSRHNANIN